MRIGILGGTFNPIHKGHLKAAELAKESAHLDEVWFVPTYETPSKVFTIERVSAKKRYKMLKLVIKDLNYSWLKVKKYEVRQKEISYTYKTLRIIRKKHKTDNLFLIMGSDRYKNFLEWNNYLEIRKKISGAIILSRNETNIKSLSKLDLIIKSGSLNISSSLTLAKSDWENIPHIARKFIAKKQLYLKSLVFYTLHKKRFQHSISVATHAKRLAVKNFYFNTKRAYNAGLVHDLFKYVNFSRQKKIIKEYKPNWKKIPEPILHGYTAMLWLENIYGIKDKKFLSAIRKHSTGSKKMSKLDKIIYVADKISSDRKGEKIGKIRKLAYSNLNLTFLKLLKMNVNKLNKKNINISGELLEAYNVYILKKDRNYAKIKKI